MKNFRIQIRYHGHFADFKAMAEDSIEGIEKVVLDKLGKNEVKFESDGFTSKTGKWITYEEVNHDRGPIQTQEVLGIKLGARAS